MKILVIRFSSIGDIVLTTPVVRCLKLQRPDVEIHYLTKPAFAPIVQDNPYVTKVHVLEKDWSRLILSLKNESFDEIIDLHRNLRTLKIKWALRNIASYSFPKLNFRKWLLTTFKMDKMPSVHIVDRYLATVAHLGILNDGEGLDYFIPEKDRVLLDVLPDICQKGYVGIVIGASYATKKMPLHQLIALCRHIEFPIVLLGGKEDAANGDDIANSRPGFIYNACGQFNLNQSADIVRQANVIISHDTGLMHIAAAFQKRILSVWGNTVPALGMYPYYGNREGKNTSFEVGGLPCRPCSKIGYKSCPKKHFKCMELQDVQAIAQKATALF